MLGNLSTYFGYNNFFSFIINIGSEENDLPNFEYSTDGDKKPVIKKAYRRSRSFE